MSNSRVNLHRVGLTIGLALTICICAEAGNDKSKIAWKPLFNGKTLAGWKETNFGGEGEVHVENGAIVMERGTDMTGVTYTAGDFPKMNYEVSLEGKRVKGLDFFCTTTFPVGDTHCSLVVGGWAGSVVGLSTIDGADAMRNDTKTLHDFKDNQWYRVRFRVMQDRIQAWIDDKQVVNLATKGKKISIRAETDLCRPFGIATWNTVGAVRDIKVRSLTGDELKPAEPKKDAKRKLRFTISKETTYITEPLDKDGYPDYMRALNERLRKGVTAKNNAFALMMEAFGPRLEKRLQPAEFYQLLGIAEPPDPGDYYRYGHYYLKDVHNIAPQIAIKLIDQASEQPWRAKQFPLVAAWFKSIDRPMVLVGEASRLERFYHPLVVTKDEKAPAGITSALLSGIQNMRSLAYTLTIRSMGHIGEGHFDKAWEDQLTMHRLGRLVAQGGTYIEGLVGVAIDSIASHQDLVFLEYAKLDVKKLRSCLNDLQKLPPMPSMADKVDLGERVMFLDTVLLIDRHGSKALDNLRSSLVLPKIDLEERQVEKLLERINWDAGLRAANRWFDRLAAAMREKDRPARQKKIAEVVEELKKGPDGFEMLAFVNALLKGNEKWDGASEKLAKFLVAQTLPSSRRVQDASDRSEQTHRNLHLAFALAAYQKENGRYPKTLDALAPKYLAKIPEDLFSGKPIIYRPKDNGYLLYSIGPNGVDEKGRWYDDDPPGDDPRVRMPLPPPKNN